MCVVYQFHQNILLICQYCVVSNNKLQDSIIYFSTLYPCFDFRKKDNKSERKKVVYNYLKHSILLNLEREISLDHIKNDKQEEQQIFIFLFSCRAALQTTLSVCLSVCPSVCLSVRLSQICNPNCCPRFLNKALPLLFDLGLLHFAPP